jgi:AcrR family transcriptional regulator
VTGLRERKKTATREALHEAALRLAVETGLDCVTVEGIADAANVSRRTFSNYFSNKEEALLYGDEVRLRMLTDRIHARPPDEPAWTALTRSALDMHRRLGERDPGWVAQTRLLRLHPSLLSRQIALQAGRERELAAAITPRLPDDGQRALRAQVMAAAFTAGLRISLRTWLEAPTAGSLPSVIERVLALIGEGFV